MDYAKVTFYTVVVAPAIIYLILFAKYFIRYLVHRKRYPEIYQRQGTYRIRDLFKKMYKDL